MTRHGETDTERDERPQDAGTARHAAADGAGVHPLIDLKRDPTPGIPDHAATEDE